MATGFQFDTSGMVILDEKTHDAVIWGMLSPFVQGYVEALFGGALWADTSKPAGQMATAYAFSDLAPETLARIMEDCERMAAHPDTDATWYIGKQFWHIRNAGSWSDYPPLTPYPGEDGKVYLREAS